MRSKLNRGEALNVELRIFSSKCSELKCSGMTQMDFSMKKMLVLVHFSGLEDRQRLLFDFTLKFSFKNF